MTQEEAINCITEKLKHSDKELEELKEKYQINYELSFIVVKPAMSFDYVIKLLPDNREIPTEIKQFYQSIFESCV